MGKGNEPAYPVINSAGYVLKPGLTKREYFAGLAMQGMLAGPDAQGFPSVAEAIKHYAELSVSYADALLAALERSHDGG